MEREIAARYVSGRWVAALGGRTILDPGTRSLPIKSGEVVYPRARPETLIERLQRETGNRPLLAGEGSPAERIHPLLEQRGLVCESAGWVVDTDGLSKDQVASLLFRRVTGNADD